MERNAKNTRPGKGTSVIYSWFHPTSAASSKLRSTALIGMTVTGMTRHILTHGSLPRIDEVTYKSRFQNSSYKGVNQAWQPEEISA
ncbi:hypothetical protein [Paenibacillus sp. JNUCC31]|uniref:hypothetical protein n=1 Tax=Paenibacillus sp. JNUCC-31 TaxID=2777983 RepID=UPI001E46F91A|nr:hypothetical protein [Paenibacillus sp. JNUCC-31]